MLMVNTILFGAGAGMVALAWMRAIHEQNTGAELIASVLTLQEPLLLITVAILLGGVFHSFTILYPTLLQNREEKQKALNKVDDFRDQAYRDSLTGLNNRRYFDEIFDAYFTEFANAKLAFGLLTLDVDHFKRINDTHGHEVGDMVLKSIADCARNLTRENDVIARIGGEEFAIIVSFVTEQQLSGVAERFRSAIAKLEISCETGTINPTISVGAVLSKGHDSTASIMRSADKCLYQAKDNGRNQVVSSLQAAA